MTPMPPTELNALAEKVEALDGLSREVDAEISACLRIGAPYTWAFNYPEWEGRADGRVYLEKGGPSFAANFHTASLDAATTVFPADTLYRSGHDGAGPDPSLFYCEAITAAPACHKVRAVASTEPNARLACALRARAASLLTEEGA